MVVETTVRLDRDQLLQGVRALAEEALAVFGLEGAELTLLEYKQNATFRVDRPAQGERFLLRLCMPGRYDEAILRSELLWLLSLRQAGVIVPEPVPARDGALVPTLALPLQPEVEPRAGVLFRWLPGRPLEGALTPALAEKAGRTLGRLHRHAVEFEPPAGFERPRWNLARLIGDPEVFPGGRLPGGADALLSSRDLAFLEEAGRVVRAEIANVGEGPEAWGLIHTDLEPDNLIVDGGELRPIDFEHCGWGWYLYDVAASLLPMADKPGFPALRQAFLRGYQAERPLPPGDEARIDIFLVARCLFSLRLIFLEAWDHPALREEAVSLVPYMLGGIRRILAQRADAAPAALSIVQLLARLRTLGIKLWVEGGALRFSAPKGALDGTLKAELSARKAEILEFLQQASRGAAEAPPPIPRASRDLPLPLSFPQQRLWLIDQLDPGTPAYNLPVSFRLEGRIDVPLLGRVLDEIVARHEVLRTTFAAGPGDDPIQVIAPSRRQPLPFVDLRGLPAAAREPEARRLAAEDTVRGFDLAAGPLLRTTLVALAESDAVLITNMHHIISDGWSGGIFVREVGVLYDALGKGEPSPLPELPVQYADFAAWQRGWLQGEVLAGQIAYWKQRLAGAPALLELPTDRPRPPVQSHHGLGRTVGLSRELTDALKGVAQREGATPFMVLLAGFSALLARFSGQETVVLGSPTAGRSRPELEGLIGFFVNMLVLRADLGTATTFRELIAQVRRTTLEAFQHQDLSFEQLVEELTPQRNLSYSPIFQVTFVLQNAPGSALRMPGVVLRRLAGTRSATPFDLALSLEEGPHGLEGSLRARRDLFDATTVERIMARYAVLLTAAAADPDVPCADLPLLSLAERHLLAEWNDTAAGFRMDEPVHRRIAARAALHPEHIALVFEGEALTYAEMMARARQLASHLRELGVGPEVVVGVHLERSLELIVALLAVLEAGGAYLPLEPTYPAERLGWMLEDSGAPVVLSLGRLAGALPASAARVIRLDEIAGELARRPAAPLPPVDLDGLAYVIFTSGSTGRPKGVLCHHRGLVNRLLWMESAYPTLFEDRVLQKTPFSFDVSVWEIFGPLAAGARLVIARPGGHQDSAYLVETLVAEGITWTHFVPSMLRVFLEESGLERCVTLRRVSASGEALPADLVARFQERLPGVELLNLYGPTEAAIEATAWPCDVVTRGGGVPIGRPISNVTIHLLDARLWPVPVGVPGELHIGGVGVARGYLGRPALSAERFVPDAWSAVPGARLYKTGDLARWSPEGAIEYLGRIDHQVKIRGFRIELGEIEAALGAHPAVHECVVVAREDRFGTQRLVAYVVPDDPAVFDTDEVLGSLRSHLPAYMVPALLVRLERLPLGSTGKVDRKALPAPDEARSAAESVAPRTPLEELVAGVWGEMLGLEQVGVTESFFELGGQSLLATRVVSRLRQLLHVQVPLRALFETPTVAELARRLEEMERGSTGGAGIPRADRSRPLPLSFAQERLWFLDQLDPGQALYNIPAAVRLEGRLDLAVLAAAFGEIVRRHEALRTTFALQGEAPVQVVMPPGTGALPLVDLGGLPAEAREAEVRRQVADEVSRPFDLATGPLLRVTVLRLDATDHVVLADMHHIVSDGWSVGVLIRELVALYEAFGAGRLSPLPELPIQYADFAAWQRSWLSGEVLAAQLAWWRQRLAGAPFVLELPADRPRPAVPTGRGGGVSVRLPAGLTAALHVLSRREGATPFMTLLALFQALLARHAGVEDVLVGSPIANRHRTEVEPLIGFFVNTLVLRGQLTGAPNVRQLLARVREGALGAYAHQDLPFERLVEELSPERDLARSPLFQVMFVLQNAPAVDFELSGLTLRSLPLPAGAAKFDLSLSLAEEGGALAGRIDFSADLFDAPTVLRFAGRFQALLEAATADPDRSVGDLPLLTAAERHVLSEWNDTTAVYPAGICVHQQIEQVAARHPDRVALVYEEEALTYAEMDRRANRLAWLLRELGVGPEVVVGVHLERSLDLVLALQAILKAGGAYLPLDPAYPAERLSWMLEDSRASIVLSDSHLAGSLPPGPARILEIDRLGDEIARRPSTRPPFEGGPDHLAYVIFTSGSTGRPKGVMCHHRGLFNRLVWMHQAYPVLPEDRLLQKTPFSFDVSVWEFFWPFMYGACLVVARPGGHQDSAYLVDTIEAQGITTIHFVPSMLRVFLEESGLERCGSLRRVCASGEALPPDLAGSFFDRLDAELINLYGPTEAAIDVSSWVCHPDNRHRGVPIGRPIANVALHVLDIALLPAPIGVPGELHIGGVATARGYLGRPDLTADRFIPDAGSGQPGARLYKTGDLARWRPDGAIDYLGRIDHQVKIRGFRIELGEIEAVLGESPAVRECVVVAREDRPGSARLVAYAVPASGAPGDLDVEEVLGHLRERLPAYMVPAVLVPLERLPLNSNGKVDRKALPAPGESRSTGEGTAPRTPLEELIAGVWSEILGLERVGVEESFFALGGHSLLATRVVSRLRKLLRVELPLRALFEAPTVADLARRLDEAERGADRAIPPADRDRPLPLSFAQERLWFLDQLEPGSARYNIPAVVRLEGQLDLAALAAACAEIVRRHESLRTTFSAEEGNPVQIVALPAGRDLPLVDLAALPGEAREDEALRLVAAEILRPFDLIAGPLLRVSLVRLSREDHVLLANMHHIVSDGWSVGVLIREMGALYGAFAQGRPSPLAELPIQYADFAVWQRGWLRGEALEAQLAWWRERLAGAPTVLDLPTDRPRPAVQSSRGGTVPLRFSAELMAGLHALSRREGATLFMTLLGLFQVLLGRHAGQEDLLVGTPIANRQRAELEPLIGFFVNTLVFRGEISGDQSVRGLLARVREGALGAYAHQDLPFERLVEELAPRRDLGRSPLFQVLFALQNAPSAPLELPGLRLREMPLPGGAAKFDLSLTLIENGEALAGSLDYDADLFDSATVERIAERLRTLLAAAVADPDLPVRDLPVISEAESHLLSAWNDTSTSFHAEGLPGTCVHERIAARADLHPHRVALSFEGEELTYAAMVARAWQLAGLLREHGVGPGVAVGVHLERSLDLVIALLGVLEAGGAYLPLEPTYPAERLAWMLEDSGAPVVLSHARLASDLPETGARVIRLDEIGEELARRPAAALSTGVGPDDLAYVIFTSGSTGRPKGVLCHHRGLMNRLLWMEEAWPVIEGERVLQKTPFSFDVSVWEIFGPLAAGARLVIARPGGHQDSAYLVDTLAAEAITWTHFVPSMLRIFLEESGLERCATLRRVSASGEALSPDLVERFHQRLPGVELVNLYGPTEAAIEVTAWACEPQGDLRNVPIGRPIANVTIHLLDTELRPVPVGVPGELHIGGIGVARGYLNRPALTAERFIPDAWSSVAGRRLYKTGDLARWRPDGAVEYLGRIDNQVKIRGFRIELGEIEAALEAHPAVRECVVLAREDRSGSPRLVAYAVAAAGDLDAEEVLGSLRSQLPSYMVPPVLVRLERLPLGPTGKVNRKALPAPEEARSSSDGTLPRTPLEELLAGVWAEVLGLERVGAEESFFDLGGHSLLATRVVSRLRKLLPVEIPLRVLFEAPTVAELARRLDAAERGGEGAIPRLDRDRPLPLSFAQERLWFLDQLEPGSARYNIPAVVRLEGPLDPPVLAAACDEIVRRHETLRTTLISDEGIPVQIVAPPVRRALPVVDLEALPRELREAEARHLATEEVLRPFDLTAGPLFRCTLLRLGTLEHVAIVNMHHVISDGWSVGVLIRELAVLYGAFGERRPSPLPELPVQYADFAAWQRAWLGGGALEEQLAYWRQRLAGAPTVLELPTDRPRPAVQSTRAGTQPLRLPADLTAGLQALARREGATLFMTLLGLFQVLLGRHADREDLLVGSPIANRTRSELEPLIGLFVNTLVLRGELSGAPSVRGLLARVRENALGAYAHQDLPFERLVEELEPRRDLGRTPLFQILFVLQNVPAAPLELPGLRLREVPLPGGAAKFDLSLTLQANAEGELAGGFEYGADLFDPPTLLRLADRFQHLLVAAVADPDLPVGALPLAGEAERHALLAEWNDTATLLRPEGGLVHERIACWAALDPTRAALIFEGQALTWAEMTARAHRLAWHLRSLGVGRETIVGVCLERSPDLIVALLGVLAAGAAYLPLEPSYPIERRSWMLEDSGAPVLLTDSRLAAAFPAGQARVLCLDQMESELSLLPLTAPSSEVGLDDLAYVIFTSGSTGRPKGVMCHHRGLLNRLQWMEANWPSRPGDRVLQKTPFGFDVSVWEIFGPLMAGIPLVVARPEGHQDSGYLTETIATERVTIAHFVPSMLRVFLEESSLDRCRSLRRVSASGEALPADLVARFHARLPEVELLNLYGPTEAAIEATAWPCPLDGVDRGVPIGRPIANVAIHLLDRQLRPAPIGIPGELCIGGVGVARGYLGRPDLTADRFIPDPWPAAAGARLYRTGDLARWRADGTIDYLGRIDHQVKIRGVRIELGEIEAVLNEQPSVRDSVVEVRGERLIAWVVPALESTIQEGDLIAALRGRLPSAMVPSAFVILDRLPLNPNGKVDRRALPEPGTAATAGGPDLPRDRIELELVRLWEELLGHPVGVRDDFFALGGHSLLALRLLAGIERRLRVRLPVATLFRTPTVEALAETLRGRLDGHPSSPLVPLRAGGELRPFFWVHAAAGNVFCYAPLAWSLDGGHPVHGLEAPGVNGSEAPLDQVEALAAHHSATLRQAQPHGPYLLGGWSFGGLVAFEIARRLEAEGEEVELLALVDSVAPGSGEGGENLLSDLATFGRDLGLPIGHSLLRGEELAGLTDEHEILERAWEPVRQAGLLPPDLDLPRLRELFAVFRAHLRAQRSYRPATPWNGRATLFLAEERPAGESASPEQGWRELATGGLEVVSLAGDHYTILREPSVRVLAERLRMSLERIGDATRARRS